MMEMKEQLALLEKQLGGMEKAYELFSEMGKRQKPEGCLGFRAITYTYGHAVSGIFKVDGASYNLYVGTLNVENGPVLVMVNNKEVDEDGS